MDKSNKVTNPDEATLQIIKYQAEAPKAIASLCLKLGLNIASIDFQYALASVMGIDRDSTHLVFELNMSADEMIESLKDYQFTKIFEIHLENSILPEGLPGLLVEEIVKQKGEIWVIHMNDADPLPSNPHAHHKINGCKLHLGNGQLFSPKNKPLNKQISKKDLIAIRGKIKNIDLPNLSI